MEQQKHFHYEGNVTISIKPKNVEIVDLIFLTPAKVSIKADGRNQEIVVGVDLINRKVYENNVESQYSDKIFEYLDSINTMPENFFEASDEDYRQAAESKLEHDSILNRMKTDV